MRVGIVLVALLIVMSRSIEAFDCVRVMGYSTVRSWYGAEKKDKFEKYIADESKWELLFQPASIISRWADPSWAGWKASDVRSRCKKRSGDPDIVLLSVAAKHTNVDGIAKDINTTIGHIHRHWKNVTMIILQPQIGGVNDQICNRNGKRVRDSWTHPYIDKAIARVAGSKSEVVAGMSLEVSSCGDWSDNLGHIKSSVTAATGKRVADYYNNFFKSQTIPGGPVEPVDPGTDPVVDPVDPDPGETPPYDGPSCGPQEWKAESFDRQTEDFSIACDAEITGSNFMQAIVALADKADVAEWNDNACLIRFKDGIVDVRNQGSYVFADEYRYTVGKTYHLWINVDMNSSTYTTWIKADDDADWAMVGEQFMFREDWVGEGALSHIAWRTLYGGCVAVSNVKIGPVQEPPAASTPVIDRGGITPAAAGIAGSRSQFLPDGRRVRTAGGHAVSIVRFGAAVNGRGHLRVLVRE